MFQNSQKSMLFTLNPLLGASKGAWNWKNHCLLTFAVIKLDWDVARSPRSILRIDMIPNNSKNTYIAVAKLFKKFYARLKSTHHLRERPLFGTQMSHLAQNPWKSWKNEYWVAFSTLQIDLDVILAHRLRFWIALIILNLPTTYRMYVGLVT